MKPIWFPLATTLAGLQFCPKAGHKYGELFDQSRPNYRLKAYRINILNYQLNPFYSLKLNWLCIAIAEEDCHVYGHLNVYLAGGSSQESDSGVFIAESVGGFGVIYRHPGDSPLVAEPYTGARSATNQKGTNMACFSFLKTMMFIFNGTIFVGGITVLGIGIWVKVDGGSFVKILGVAAPQLMQVVNVGYLCMAVGGFLILMGFLGCCGALRESRCMLLLFFSIILIIFIVEIAGAVVVLAFSSLSKIITEYFGNMAVRYLKNNYGQNNELNALWNTTMKEMKCCGFYGYEDFSNSTYYHDYGEYPPICCSNLSPCQKENISSTVKGCFSAFEHMISRNGKIVGGVALGICGLELAAMIVSLVLFCQIGNK